jgi:hypothetical protein
VEAKLTFLVAVKVDTTRRGGEKQSLPDPNIFIGYGIRGRATDRLVCLIEDGEIKWRQDAARRSPGCNLDAAALNYFHSQNKPLQNPTSVATTWIGH